MTKLTNLLDFAEKDLAAFCVAQGEPAFRAQQLLKWIHYDGVSDFQQMTNISKAFRQRLSEISIIEVPTVKFQTTSQDGTHKWLLQLACGNCVETVFIPETTRGTLCVSSQIGCGLNCSFCATARQGFNRNLTTAEIIGQVWVAVRQLSRENGKHDRQITNVVMMGMGEPLLNLENVVNAMDIMMDDHAYGLSKYRVTLSTSGVVPAMKELMKMSPAALAVSLHAPNDELRNQLVPINKKYPLKLLMEVCKNYFEQEPKRKIMFEYVMMDGVNDQLEYARQLVKLLQGIPAKVNLIPFNPFPGTQYRRSSDEQIRAFQEILLKAGIHATRRKTRGDDKAAACGQLVGNVLDRTQRSRKIREKEERIA